MIGEMITLPSGIRIRRPTDPDHVRLARLEDICEAQQDRIEQLEEEIYDLRLIIEEIQTSKKDDESERMNQLEAVIKRLDKLIGSQIGSQKKVAQPPPQASHPWRQSSHQPNTGNQTRKPKKRGIFKW